MKLLSLCSMRSFAANKPRPRRSPRLQSITRHRSRRSSVPSVVKKSVAICFVLLAISLAAYAAGFSKTYSLSTGTITIENTQKRSSWSPVAILIHYSASVDTTITIKRINNGNEYLLSTVTLTGVQDITWIPEADYPFNHGDTLVITSTDTSGILELIQRSSP